MLLFDSATIHTFLHRIATMLLQHTQLIFDCFANMLLCLRYDAHNKLGDVITCIALI